MIKTKEEPNKKGRRRREKKLKSKTAKKAKSGAKHEHGGHKAKVVHVSQE